MPSGKLTLAPTLVCRVGDIISLTRDSGEAGSWTYPARLLWIRDTHLGVTPPPDTRLARTLTPDQILWLTVDRGSVSIRLSLLVVGLTVDLPPVLVLREEAPPPEPAEEAESSATAVPEAQHDGPPGPPTANGTHA